MQPVVLHRVWQLLAVKPTRQVAQATVPSGRQVASAGFPQVETLHWQRLPAMPGRHSHAARFSQRPWAPQSVVTQGFKARLQSWPSAPIAGQALVHAMVQGCTSSSGGQAWPEPNGAWVTLRTRKWWPAALLSPGRHVALHGAKGPNAETSQSRGERLGKREHTRSVVLVQACVS
jgi:hypothetical protein